VISPCPLRVSSSLMAERISWRPVKAPEQHHLMNEAKPASCLQRSTFGNDQIENRNLASSRDNLSA